jgi:hypothetical protein
MVEYKQIELRGAYSMKKIRLTPHAHTQCEERGATEEEVIDAIRNGVREPAKHERWICRANFQYNEFWRGEYYKIKQVAPIIAEEADEIVVVTVYTFYF